MAAHDINSLGAGPYETRIWLSLRLQVLVPHGVRPLASTELTEVLGIFYFIFLPLLIP